MQGNYHGLSWTIMENFLKCHKIEFIYPFFPAPQLSEVFDHDDVDQVDEERQLLLLVSDDLPSSNRQNEEDPLNIMGRE